MSNTNENSDQLTTPVFQGLQAYSESQAGSFFGRDDEIDKLSTLIKINSLTIVFGKSGTGKTSLLNAGIFPGLRKKYMLPFRIRLEFNDSSTDLVTQIKNVLKTEIDKYGFKVKTYPGPETLWEYFHKEPLWQIVTPILVFDQFEEIFTLAKLNNRYGEKELPAFWQELSDIIENNIPEELRRKINDNKKKIGYNYKNQNTKVVFAFREEYLAEFETVSSKIPSIKVSRFRLLPMNGYQAYDVITKTWKGSIREPEAKQIVSYLNDTPKLSYDLITIEPSLLSQVCTYIDRERISSGIDEVSPALLEKYKERTDILRPIYNKAIGDAEQALPAIEVHGKKKTGDRVQQFLENNLVNSEGYRTRYALSGDDNYVLPGIAVLQGMYFIREDNKTIELTHDVLLPIIIEDRETRRMAAAAAAEKKKRFRLTALILLLLLVGSAFAFIKITKEAKAQKKAAEIVVANLKKDSMALAIKNDSLQNISNSLNSEISRKNDELNKAQKKGDTKRVQQLEDELRNLRRDSINLRLKQAASDRQIGELDRKLKSNFNVSYSEMMENPEPAIRMMKMAKLNSVAEDNEYYDELLKKIKQLEKDTTNLNARYNRLDFLFNQHLRIHDSKPFPPSLPVMPGIGDTSNSWKISLYHGSGATIYLIPDISGNGKFIRQAKFYEIGCDPGLRKAAGFKEAVFYGGYFYFKDVDPGTYMIKICGYYGGYYMKRKTAKGIETLKLDASPPLK